MHLLLVEQDVLEEYSSQLSLKSEVECDDVDLSFLDTFAESSYLEFSKLWNFYYKTFIKLNLTLEFQFLLSLK